MKAGGSSCLGRKGGFPSAGPRFRLSPEGSICYVLLIPRDSEGERSVRAGGRGGMKGSLTSERLSLDRPSPHPSGPDRSPSGGKRTAQEAQSRAKELFKKKKNCIEGDAPPGQDGCTTEHGSGPRPRIIQGMMRRSCS